MCKYHNSEFHCPNPGRYNYPEQYAGAYCHVHKKEKMIYKSNPLCSIENCHLYARYSYSGLGFTHCRHHKLPEMIDYREMLQKENKKISIKPTKLRFEKRKDKFPNGTKSQKLEKLDFIKKALEEEKLQIEDNIHESLDALRVKLIMRIPNLIHSENV